jgi:hypothetical protein
MGPDYPNGNQSNFQVWCGKIRHILKTVEQARTALDDLGKCFFKRVDNCTSGVNCPRYLIRS